ncbi:MAG: acylphosphatase [Gemmatimonadota bacterium]|jgi:acylphosphatase
MCADQEAKKAFKVHGRVQGVGFRWWAQHQARSLGLRGTVRNCADGAVEIAFAGGGEAVEEMRRRLETGPPASYVVSLEELEPPERFPPDFQIGF